MTTPEPVPLSWAPRTDTVTTLFIAVAAAASTVPSAVAAAGALPPWTEIPDADAAVAGLPGSSGATAPPPTSPPSTAVTAATAASRFMPPLRFGAGPGYGHGDPFAGGTGPVGPYPGWRVAPYCWPGVPGRAYR